MYNKTYHKFIERNDFSGNKKKFLECGEYNYKSSFIGLKKKGIMKLPMDMHSNGLLILGSYKSYRRRFANHYAKELIKKGTKVLYITDALSEEQYRPKFEIESFHGFFGIYNIPIWLSIPLALLIMITIINAYNLVDGIDGLAASISTVALSCFAICFFWIGRNFLALTAVSMIGSLLGFLIFNLSEKRKIFMGDTGSLVIGFLLAVLSIRLLALDEGLSQLPFNSQYVPLMMGTFILIPLFDVLRVFSIRILQGNSPFLPDRNHIHHVVIDKFKWSHRRTAFSISVFSFLIVLCTLVLILIGFNLNVVVVFLLAIICVLTIILNMWRKSNG